MRNAAFEQVEQAADLGTMIHGALEAAMAGEPYDPELRVYIQPVLEWKEKTGIQIVDREIRLVNKAEGFAGTADVLFRYGQQGIGILDYKTRKTKRAKSSRLTTTRRCSWRRMPRPTGGRRTSTGCWLPTCSSRPPSPAGWKWSSTRTSPAIGRPSGSSPPCGGIRRVRPAAAIFTHAQVMMSLQFNGSTEKLVTRVADTPTRASSEGLLCPPAEWAAVAVGPIVAVDFETFYTTSYSIKKLGRWAYVHDPRFEAYLVAVTDGNRTCVCHPSEFPWATITGRPWLSHNRDFDRAVFERLREQGKIHASNPPVWWCSAALCAYLQHPRDLAGAAKAVLGITLDKSIRTRAKGRVPTQDELFGCEISRYAARDAETCLALWLRLERHWPVQERQLFELTSDLGRRGLAVDWDYVRSKRRELENLVKDLQASLPWRPATSVKQFREACQRAAVPPPRSTSNSDPSFLRWLDTNLDSKAATWIRHLQRLRSANRTARVLEAMEARRMTTGRMAYELKYFGASTGRWSGGGDSISRT